MPGGGNDCLSCPGTAGAELVPGGGAFACAASPTDAYATLCAHGGSLANLGARAHHYHLHELERGVSLLR